MRDTDETRRAMGNRVDIIETKNGEVRICHKGALLRARAVEKEGHVQQAAIVDNKVLGAALQHARGASAAAL